jgi:hypothetical protein
MKSDPWFVLHRMPNRSLNHFQPEISIHGFPVAITISDSDDEPSSPFGPGKITACGCSIAHEMGTIIRPSQTFSFSTDKVKRFPSQCAMLR